MLLASFDGAGNSSYEGVKCFKPIQKLFVREIVKDNVPADFSDLSLRVRMVSSATGSDVTIVSETNFDILSEISSKKEGFCRRAPRFVNAGGSYNNYVFVLNDSAAINLSNDKYLHIDLLNASPSFRYEVYGFEYPILSDFFTTYHKQYISERENEKDFFFGDAEYLAIPIFETERVQFYLKDGGQASPIYTAQELKLDQEMSNDLVTVQLNVAGQLFGKVNNDPETEYHSGICNVPIEFGFRSWAYLDVSLYSRMTLTKTRESDGFEFFLIDNKLSVNV